MIKSFLADAEGNFLDGRLAEAMLQTVENFLAPIADDFREPHAAVHIHEQGAFMQVRRLGVRGDSGINQRVPDFHDLGIGAARIEFQIHHQLRQQISDRLRRDGPRFFQRPQIHAAPLREDAGAGGTFARPARRDFFQRRSHAEIFNRMNEESKKAGS